MAITASAWRRARPRARGARSGGTRRRPYSAWISSTRASGERSISRDSSTNGTPQRIGEQPAERRLAGAAQADQRDAPARGRPRGAGVAEQAASARRAPPPARRPSARAAGRRSAAVRANRARRRRRAPPAGTPARPRPAAARGSTHCPRPISRLARWRSDTSASAASALRVRPRRARSVRTRSPSAPQERGRRASASGAACVADSRDAKSQSAGSSMHYSA